MADASADAMVSNTGDAKRPARYHPMTMPTDDYLQINRANWNDRAAIHAASPDYGFDRFASDRDHLSHVIAFDVPRLGDIRGLEVVHLQCHIGTDTLSLSRLGARVTGLDFSPAALAEARRLAELAGAEVRFVESDLYNAPSALGHERFDLVYTGIGALCWLPSIERWARAVAGVVKRGGRLFLREGHPVLWALDERPDALVLRFPYFEREEPVIWDDENTYVSTDAKVTATVTHEWNHGLGEIINALIAAGFEIQSLEEHQSVPWEALPGQMERRPDGEWVLTREPWRAPLTYTLQAIKRR